MVAHGGHRRTTIVLLRGVTVGTYNVNDSTGPKDNRVGAERFRSTDNVPIDGACEILLQTALQRTASMWSLNGRELKASDIQRRCDSHRQALTATLVLLPPNFGSVGARWRQRHGSGRETKRQTRPRAPDAALRDGNPSIAVITSANDSREVVV